MKKTFGDIYHEKDREMDGIAVVYIDGQKINVYEVKIASRVYEQYEVDSITKEPFGYVIRLNQPEIIWNKQEEMEFVNFTDVLSNKFGSEIVGFVTVSIGFSYPTHDVTAEVGIAKCGDSYMLDFLSQGVNNEEFVGGGFNSRNIPVKVPEEVRADAIKAARTYVEQNKAKIFGEELEDDIDR